MPPPTAFGSRRLGEDDVNDGCGHALDERGRHPLRSQEKPGQRCKVLGHRLGAMLDSRLRSSCVGDGPRIERQIAIGQTCRHERAHTATSPHDRDLNTSWLHEQPFVRLPL